MIITNTERVVVVKEESVGILDSVEKTGHIDCIWVERKKEDENISEFLA